MTGSSSRPSPAQGAPSSGGSRRETLELVAVAALAMLLRVTGLGSESLWLDEALSLSNAHALTWPAQLRPLYFLFLEGWLHLGHGEVFLRLPSALFGTGAVAVLWLVARRLTTVRIATLSALLMALAAPEIACSQEVRMYPLASLLALGAVLSLIVWRESGRWPLLAAHALLAGLAITATPVTLLLLVPAGVLSALSLAGDRRRVRALIGAWCALLLALTPWYVFALRAGGGRSPLPEWIDAPSVKELATMPARLLVSSFYHIEGAGAAVALLKIAGIVATLLAALAAVTATPGRHRLLGIALAATWGVTSLSLFMYSHVATPVFHMRYLQAIAAALYLLVAIGLARLARLTRLLAIAFGTLLLGAMAACVVTYHVVQQREDWRGVARWVANVAGEQDCAYLLVSYWRPAWEYYYPYETRSVPGLKVRTDMELDAPDTAARVFAAVSTAAGESFIVTRGPFDGDFRRDLVARAVAAGRRVVTHESRKISVIVLEPERVPWPTTR